MTTKLVVPDIGEFENVEVIELLVKTGDQIKINDPVVTIESDKSSVEIPSTISGKIELINVKLGDKVSKGDLLLTIESSKETTTEKEIPKDTDNIIKQAEAVLKVEEKKKILHKEKLPKKETSKIQLINSNDIDPLETQEWLELIKLIGKERIFLILKLHLI